MIFIDCTNGAVLIFRGQNDFVKATPEDHPGAVLLWLREHTRRLLDGIYEAKALQPEAGSDTRGINLFPCRGPHCTTAVTNCVKITSSAVLMPEHSQGWAYSIRMRLLSPGEEGYKTESERGFKTCQLSDRHWIIKEEGKASPQDVRGKGVIGMYPILTEGGWILNDESDPNFQYNRNSSLSEHKEERKEDFVYQSCSGRFREGAEGHFSGDMNFVPGTVRDPTGTPFAVEVA
eukprot:CAMPEP_0114507422 /NCGR_PEP_ID=MMETSP0109-20121206/12002_1 /TAXON_ID=29199 /ORGANISM="Chlorarachnion reptans, Strain CCCM449" /LENGTH=232 /DNA_ID=CAMNT_0001686175 /DNA_START=646 /DNA_END=1341 /DNA_ORIENTATION=+